MRDGRPGVVGGRSAILDLDGALPMLGRMAESAEGFRGLAALSARAVTLPVGRLVHGDEGSDDHPALWVSDGPASGQLWAALRLAHERSGL